MLLEILIAQDKVAKEATIIEGQEQLANKSLPETLESDHNTEIDPSEVHGMPHNFGGTEVAVIAEVLE
ncbi:MAG: hypothetical protein ACRYE9_04940 [Janthinobacterium lividum]